MKKITQIWMFIALLCSSTLLMAQNEGTDFPNTGTGPSYNLTIGANGFSGNVSTPMDRQDRFQIVLGSGQSITSISASATGGGATGFIQVGNGSVSFPGGNITPVPSSAGTYQVLVSTDFSTGTDWSITVNVTGSAPPCNVSASISSQTNVTCNGGSTGSATATASGGSGGYSYSWSPSGGNNATASGLSAGTYTVTVTDGNGCDDTASVTITEPPIVVASGMANSNVTCNGGSDGSAMVTASGGTGSYSYSWSPSGGNNATATGLAAGTYTVTVTDGNTCQATATVTITEPVAVVATITGQTNASCPGAFDGSATVSVSGGVAPFDYQWSNGALTENTNATTNTVNGLDGTTYNVTITDANGCSDNTTVTITDTDTTPPVANCAAPFTVQLDASGNASITVNDIDNGSTDNCGIASVTINQSTFSCEDVGDTTITLTVTDNSGNIDTCTTIVTVKDMIAPTITCTGDITMDNDLGVCEANVTIPTPTVSDNCGGESPIGLQFDGTNDYVNFPLPNVFTDIANNDFTIEMWVNPTNSGTTQRLFFAQENATNFTSLLLSSSNQLYFYVNNTVSAQINSTLTFNAWSHITARWNAATQTPEIFINGMLQATVSGGNSSTGLNNSMTLGARTDGAQVFQGTIDEVRIWNTAQSETDIQNNYSSCVDFNNPNLEAYYQLNDNTGSTTVSDATGNGYTGTLVNIDATTAWVAGQVVCAPPITLVNNYNNTDNASDIYPIGTTTVTWTATDASGNTATCSFDVTVNDTEAPVANCATPFTVQLDANGEASITAEDIDDGSADNCGESMLVGASPNDDTLSFIDPATYTETGTPLSITVGGTAVNGVNGMDRSPADGLLYIIVKPNGGGRRLATLDTATGEATLIGSGNLAENFASITFDVSGTLYGVTGDGSSTAETLFTIDTATAAITQVLTLGNGSDGEAIAFNPEDGLIYHWSGLNTNFAFESIDPATLAVTPITVTGFATDEIFGAQYMGNNTFILANLDQEFVTMTTTGVSTLVGSTVPTNYKGLEFVNDNGVTLSINQEDFTCADLGDNTIMLTVTDTAGNTSTCSTTVTVEDTIDPVANCVAPFTIQLDANGEATITADDINNNSTDNCSFTTSINVTDFDCSNVGDNPVILTVTDASGNTGTCTTTVTVEDTIAPIANCAAPFTVQLDAAGQAAITVADIENGSTDNCAVDTTSIDITDFDCSNVGDNTVTLTVTDVNGNSSMCTTIVTVEDTIAPTIVCAIDTVVSTDPGDCYATVGFPNPVALDNCSVASIVQTGGLSSGSQFPVGVSTIEFTATDANGNTSVCTFDITVEDNEAPLAVCKNITIQLDEFGAAFVTAADLDGGSTDACGIDTVEIDQDTFDCSHVGDNNVTLTVTDVNDNVSTCTSIVTVEDITAPEVVCQDITVQLDATGTVSITGMDVDGGSTDACGIASYDLNMDTFDCSNVGVHAVELTVTDVNGNSNVCTAMVTVEDNTAPDLVCTDFTLELGEDGTATLLPGDVIASNDDACGIDTTAVDITEFDCSDIGTPVTVQVFVSDVNGNLSTCMAVVTVVDALAPEVTCPADQSVTADSTGTYAIPDYFATGEASAIDNCTSEVTITSQDPAAGDLLSEGVYTVTLTAEDDNGNIGACTFELTVESELGVQGPDTLGAVQLYPNPANNQVTIGNPSQSNLKEAVIYDLTGRVIRTIDLNGMGVQKSIDLTNLASATYIVRISGENGAITKQLIRE